MWLPQPRSSTTQRSSESVNDGELAPNPGPAYVDPTLIVAGRLDSVVGYAAPADLVHLYPHASLAVVDDAGHALPHEQPDLLRAPVTEWLERVARPA